MRRPSVRFVAISILALGIAGIATSAPRPGARPFAIDDLFQLQRVGDPQLSPDGKTVAYVVTTTDKAKNSRNSDVWLVPVAGGTPRRLTSSEKADDTPRWSPDGKTIAFVSTRDGSSQIWAIDVTGGEARKVTSIATEASGVAWSPDGKWLAFTSDVYPDCPTEAANKKRLDEVEASKVKARLLDGLLYRHWNAWKDGKRSHVFVVPVAGGAARDLTPGDADAPPFSLGGPAPFAFSPDGQEICFERGPDHEEAVSTNTDLFTVPVNGGEATRVSANGGADASPVYSPDGRFIAYRAQTTPGFEADRWRLMLFDRKAKTAKEVLSSSFDRSVGSITWSPDNARLFLGVEDQGRHVVYSLPTDGSTAPTPVLTNHSSDDVEITPDQKTLVFTRQGFNAPVEIWRANADGTNEVALTRTNESLLGQIDMRPAEEVRFPGADGTPVQAWLMKPPSFDPSRKYPLLVLIHGGPQGAWDDAFSYRWNPEPFAAAGYVVLMPNPRGSTGFGQEFTNQISGDWGGRVYEDIMRAVDHVLSLGFVDDQRMGAAGGSYGGYMVNWILGHTDRFKCLLSHAGVFNLTSMYGVTEELWFPEWEFKGRPWTSPELYEKWSPHRFVQNFKTPTLVTHGELDYRVPIGEGFQLFTSLQRMGVKSKMLYFPDEGHWILKPQNSERWYETAIGWFDQWLKPKS
ncbi:MAG: S9 family peptidase [Planctomycetes bacterium]|nr:S9 family peptidase [Planctomycetota bacterium]MBI3848368.1 S9 family peptidase [Planctomycetota bacterium]